jgi:hypothetical protein
VKPAQNHGKKLINQTESTCDTHNKVSGSRNKESEAAAQKKKRLKQKYDNNNNNLSGEEQLTSVQCSRFHF